jgi:hypothetical protein
MKIWEFAKQQIDRVDETVRPFRLWNPGVNGHEGHFERWRCYSHLKNAHLGALIECRWSEVGTSIEVVDVRTQKHWGSYTRRVADIRFIGGDNIPDKIA